jgi:hypothetical protein
MDTDREKGGHEMRTALKVLVGVVMVALPVLAFAQGEVLYVIDNMVGVGLSGPLYAKLHIKQGAADTVGLRLARDPANGGNPMIQFSDDVSHANAMWMQSGTSNLVFSPWGGNVGVGMVTPAYPLHMGNGAYCSVGGVWTNASSREYKQDIKELSGEEAEEAFSKLTPVVFAYKAVPEEHHVGFIAEDVPEMLATPDRKGLSTMDVVAVLTKVVQEQQKTIAELQARVAQLETK